MKRNPKRMKWPVPIPLTGAEPCASFWNGADEPPPPSNRFMNEM